MGCKILCEQNSPASIDLQREPGVSAVALSSRRAAVRPLGEHHTLLDSRKYRAQSLSWFMFPAAFLHLCLNLPSTLQSGLRMQSMMGYHLVGIVSDRTEGCTGLLKEQLRLYFLCRQRRLSALSKPDKCWVKCCITVYAEDVMHTASF